jgi:hypothetical protein
MADVWYCMKKEFTRWERFREWMGWHNPSDERGFDGCSFTAKCKVCGKGLLQDSQGGWF